MQKDFSPKEDDIFQDYFELISEEIMKGKDEELNLAKLKDDLIYIESLLEKTLYKKKKFQETSFYRFLYMSLKKYLDCFQIRRFNKDILYVSFSRYIEYLTFLCNNSINVISDDEQYENFLQVIPLNEFYTNIDPFLEFDLNPPESYNSIEKFEKTLGLKMGFEYDYKKNKIVQKNDNSVKVIYCDNFKASKIIWDKEKLYFKVLEVIYYINLELIYDKNQAVKNITGFSLSLYLISSALNTIPNLNLEINKLKTGSIYAKLKIWLKDINAKEETKNLFIKGKDAVMAELINKRLTDLEKSKEEIKKISKEQKILNKQIKQSLTHSQYKIKIKNELEKEQLQIESLRLQNIKSKLEIINSSVDIMARGLMSAENIEILINSKLYLKKEGNNMADEDVDINKIT